MPQGPDLVEVLLKRIHEGWVYEPGPRTPRIQSIGVVQGFGPRGDTRRDFVRVTATHPETQDWNVTLQYFMDDNGVPRIRELTVTSSTDDPHAELTASI